MRTTLAVVVLLELGVEGAQAQEARLRPSALALSPLSEGVLAAGDTVEVQPSWRNEGAGATGWMTGSALLTNGGTLLDGTATYGALAGGATGSCTDAGDCYSLTVTGARPATHWDLALTEALSEPASHEWQLHVGDSFSDVPRTSGYFRFVETLLHNGVTGGCSATTFCPDASTTRAQMAVFALLAKEGAGWSPVACGTTPAFADVPVTSPFCRWAEEMARRGIVGGCGGGNFCPTGEVSRAQMAVFVLRTLDPALSPPACETPMFADVPASSPYCMWIEEMARRGGVAGCGGGNYCPTSPVTRAQMSVFLSRTFGLTLYRPTPHALTVQPLAEITEYSWAWGSEAPVALDGSLLYVPVGSPGVAIYSLSDPTAPQRLALVGNAVLGGQGGSVAASGGRAFVATPDQHAFVELDVSNPSSPKVRSRFGSEIGIPWIERLALRGNHLFVQAGSSTTNLGGVYVFDVSASPPSLAGQYLTDLVDPGFDVNPSEWVFLARTPGTSSDNAKIDVIDMSDPAAPALLGEWVAARPLNVSGLVVLEDRLYAAGYWGGLFVLSGAQTMPLALEAEYDWSEAARYAWDVAAAPPFVFIARSDSSGGATRAFQAFRQAGASLIPVWEQAATRPIHSVAVRGDLLVTVEQSQTNQLKVLKLYRIAAD